MTNITLNSFNLDYIKSQGNKEVEQNHMDMWTDKLTTGYNNKEGLGFDEGLINALMEVIEEHDLNFDEAATLFERHLDADGDGQIEAEDAEALKTVEDKNGDGYQTATETVFGRVDNTDYYSSGGMEGLDPSVLAD